MRIPLRVGEGKKEPQPSRHRSEAIQLRRNKNAGLLPPSPCGLRRTQSSQVLPYANAAFVAGNDVVRFRIKISNSRYTCHLAARFCPRFAFRCPSKEKREQECRMRAAPAVSCAKWKRKAHTSIQGSGGDPTFPAQWLYGFLRALV